MQLLSEFSPRKILVCQQHQIGDVVLSTPCVRILHNRFPRAVIHFLTEKKCTPVLENNPYVDKVWVIDKEKGLAGMFSLYSGIRKQKFDLVVDFQQLMRLKLAVVLCGAPVRLSYVPKWYNRIFYNLCGQEAVGYAAKAKAGVLSPLGVEWDGLAPEVYITSKEKEWAKRYLAERGLCDDDFLVTVDATHRRITRKWPAEYYARLIRLVSEKHPHVKFLMLYGPGEKKTVEDIVGKTEKSFRCIVSEKQTSLRQMIALLDRADGHFGNCSAPRHFAAAVGTRSLIIHGSNKPKGWTFPSEDHGFIRNSAPGACVACNRSDCRQGTLECLYGITPEIVYERFKEFFFREG